MKIEIAYIFCLTLLLTTASHAQDSTKTTFLVYKHEKLWSGSYLNTEERACYDALIPSVEVRYLPHPIQRHELTKLLASFCMPFDSLQYWFVNDTLYFIEEDFVGYDHQALALTLINHGISPIQVLNTDSVFMEFYAFDTDLSIPYFRSYDPNLSPIEYLKSLKIDASDRPHRPKTNMQKFTLLMIAIPWFILAWLLMHLYHERKSRKKKLE